MQRSKRQLAAQFDWYLISVDRLKKVGLILVLFLLAGGGYLYYRYTSTNPKLRATRAIAGAQDALNDLAASKDFATFRGDFDRGQARLQEAKGLFSGGKYPQAEAAAIESQTMATAALARMPGQTESDAQFLTVEGDVQFQKAASSDWSKADARTPLSNGDWVKTGDNASAELIFSNGSLYTIGPNALLEIYAMIAPGTTEKQNSVQMQVGSVEINTADDASTVRTPGTRVVVRSESTAQVGVDAEDRQTRIVNLRGSSAVAPAQGGSPVALASGEQVVASREGVLSAVQKVIPPPALLTPSDNQVFQAGGSTRVQMSWAPQANAVSYQLQVSRSRLFGTLEINSRRRDTSATAQATTVGTFYWRVASISESGVAGPFSQFRRFRVAGTTPPAQAPVAALDKTPPTLQLKRPFKIGGQYYIIEGTVEPGASIFVNDQETDVAADGSFRKFMSFDKLGWNAVVVKAVDAAGNTSVQQERVLVEE